MTTKISLNNGYMGLRYEDVSLYHLSLIGGRCFDASELIATQENATRETVDQYRRQILSNEDIDPVRIISHNGNFYIDDGHHRAIAYAELSQEIHGEVYTADRTYGDLAV